MAYALDSDFQSSRSAEAIKERSLLRFITCGSVDDGKSTLIGRILYESGSVPDDQLRALESDSRKFGTQGEHLDYALLVDGLSAEREQGITIDVAYRYFSTAKRAFIVADTPGHEQYTRNMATGASNAELAIILVDARKGILPQTRRHSFIVSMVGVRHVIVAINKMDLVGYDEAVFAKIARDYQALAATLGTPDVTIIPVSAFAGDNIATASSNMPWYDGPSLLQKLETIEIAKDDQAGDFAFPVQWVNRPDSQFRGYSGQIASGRVRKGDAVKILPNQLSAIVDRIVTFDGDLDEAEAGQSVTLVLDREIDISRGDVITVPESRISSNKSIQARLIWMSAEAFDQNRAYLVKLGTSTLPAIIIAPATVLDIETYEQKPAGTIGINAIFDTRIGFDRPLPATPYRDNRDLGSFIVIDRITNEVVALGLVGDRDADDMLKPVTHIEQSADLNRTFTAHYLQKLLSFSVGTCVVALITGLAATTRDIETANLLMIFGGAEILLYVFHDWFWLAKQSRNERGLVSGDGI